MNFYHTTQRHVPEGVICITSMRTYHLTCNVLLVITKIQMYLPPHEVWDLFMVNSSFDKLLQHSKMKDYLKCLIYWTVTVFK